MTNTCFCPGCKTGVKSEMRKNKLSGKKNPSLFATPKDPALFHLWQRVIPRADRLLKRTDRVCSRHFKIEDIMFHNEPLKLYDGSVYVHWFKFPRLKKDAVPSIFSDVPGHSTYIPKMKSNGKRKYIPKMKSNEKRKYTKRKHQSTATKELKVQKTTEHNHGTEITETENESLSSKEKENVLKTDLSLLPSVILNCLTSGPQSVFGTLNKINTNEFQSLHFQKIARDNLTIESAALVWQGHVENNTLKENVSLKQSKFHSPLVSKVPERVSPLCPKSNFSSNSELVSSTLNRDSEGSVGSEASNNFSEITKDFLTSSQETVLLSNSQSNLTNSEVTHRHSYFSNSNLDFNQDYAHSNQSFDSTTKSFVTLQPLETQSVLAMEPDVVQEPSNSLNNLIGESKNLSHLLNETAVTEVIQQHSDTNFTQPPISLKDSEIDVDIPLSIAKKQFCFNLLKDNTHKIDKINSWWKINAFDNFVLCARWNSDCLVERRIIINRDLEVKVFLKEKETDLGKNLEAISVDTISKLLFRVEKLKFCQNILKKEGNCIGFLEAHFMCKRWNLCRNCAKCGKTKLKEEEKRLKKLIKISKGKVDIQFSIDV